MGCTVYDGLTLIAADRTKLPFRIVRLICDGIALIMGILLGGEIGMGTVLSFLLMAPWIDNFRRFIKNHITADNC